MGARERTCGVIDGRIGGLVNCDLYIPIITISQLVEKMSKLLHLVQSRALAIGVVP